MMSRILALAGFLLAIGLFFGYIRPTWNTDIAEIKADIASYNKALAAAKQFNDRVAALDAERATIPADQLARLAAFLPDGVDNVQLIVDLNALADRSDVELSNFDVANAGNGESAASAQGDIGDGSPIESLTVSLEAKGTYEAFRTFLGGLEQSLRPLDLKTLTISQSDTGVYTYQVELTFYWLR